MSSVLSLSISNTHTFSKNAQTEITLIEGEGVEGDAHRGTTVKHRSRVAKDPTQPNLRQVHLIHNELLEELNSSGFNVKPGDIGENILTSGIDLLSLPEATILNIGETTVRLTGLRNPCYQLDNFQQGLTQACLGKDEAGNLIRKAGVMAVVLQGGKISVGDTISVELPPEPHRKMEKV